MGKAPWKEPRPEDLSKPKKLTPEQKARAKKAGRPYPNLVDNMTVSAKKNKR